MQKHWICPYCNEDILVTVAERVAHENQCQLSCTCRPISSLSLRDAIHSCLSFASDIDRSMSLSPLDDGRLYARLIPRLNITTCPSTHSFSLARTEISPVSPTMLIQPFRLIRRRPSTNVSLVRLALGNDDNPIFKSTPSSSSAASNSNLLSKLTTIASATSVLPAAKDYYCDQCAQTLKLTSIEILRHRATHQT